MENVFKTVSIDVMSVTAAALTEVDADTPFIL